jgi:glutaredoxin
MKQKVITLLVVILIAGLLSLVVIVSNNKEKQAAEQKIEDLKQSDPIFYYGNTCPHCEIVEEWFKANQVEEKMTFAKKEVYDNRANALELNEVAKGCGLDTSSIGVPFLYADGQCLIGSPDIISYFSTKLGIDENQASESAEQAL